MALPWALARLRPSAVRVRIRSRSTSASPPSTATINRLTRVTHGQSHAQRRRGSAIAVFVSSQFHVVVAAIVAVIQLFWDGKGDRLLVADLILGDAGVAAWLSGDTMRPLGFRSRTTQARTHKLLAGIAAHPACLCVAVLHLLLLRGELRADGRR